MTVDFLKYKYEDGACGERGERAHSLPHGIHKSSIGIRHVQLVYMFLCLVVLYGVRGGAGLAVLCVTHTDTRLYNDTYLQPVEWKFKSQAATFSSLQFGIVVMSVPAEMCAHRFNAKYVLLLVLIANGLLCGVMPAIVDKGGWVAVSNAQLLCGMTQANVLVATRKMVRDWLPVSELQWGSALLYSGIEVGTLVALPVTSVFSGSWLQWRLVYYGWGAVLLCSSVVWGALTADTPARHPAVGGDERAYIQHTALTHQEESVGEYRPWREMLQRRVFWSLASAHCGYQVLYVMFLYGMPIYFNRVLRVDMYSLGWVCCVPLCAACATSVILLPGCRRLYDLELVQYLLDRNSYWRLLNTTGVLCSSLGLVSLSLASPATPVWVCVLLASFTLAATALQLSGFLAAHSAAGQFAGTVLFLTTVLATAAGAVVPLFIGFILDLKLSTEVEWRIIFLSTAAVCATCGVVYVTLASGDLAEAMFTPLQPNGKERNTFILEDMKRTNSGFYTDD